MRILVAGGAGYVGSVLCHQLLERGHKVRVLDLGLFGTEHLPSGVELIAGDVLGCREESLAGLDAVINLAGLSNDPMADFSPGLNYKLNAAAAAFLAQLCKRAGVRRFVQGSTCSVYGFSHTKEVDEDWPAKPQFPYAVSKLMAEKALWCLEDEEFRPIILRKATVVGWSPRMRYDLVVNTMVKTALTSGRIIVHNAGLWRPLVDVQDAARAYVRAVESPLELSGTFNITYANFTVGTIARRVVEAMADHGVEVTLQVEHRDDPRSYRVSNRRARERLGFTARVPIYDCVADILERINGGIHSDLDNPRYVNIEWIKRTAVLEERPLVASRS